MDHLRGIACLKYRASRDEYRRSRVDAKLRCFGIDPAVDLNFGGESAAINHLPQFCDLIQRFRDELLPAVSGIDGHDQHEITIWQDLFCHNRGVCRG